jgi:hypothetical protein
MFLEHGKALRSKSKLQAAILIALRAISSSKIEPRSATRSLILAHQVDPKLPLGIEARCGSNPLRSIQSDPSTRARLALDSALPQNKDALISLS